MILDVIKSCRSYRRFKANSRLNCEVLRSFVESARYTPSAANQQKLRYSVFCDKENSNKVFESLKFAGYLKDWDGPALGERPLGYIVISSDSQLTVNLAIDLGISAEAILLTATESGFGGCMFRSFDAKAVEKIVGVEGMIPHLVIAFGEPNETVVVCDAENGEIKYYRDEQDRHIVPKLPLSELFLN